MTKQTQIEHGGPAFPCDRISVNGGVVCATGMTLRDHFAGLAMQGLIAHDAQQTGWAMNSARLAYEVADAMLESRTTPSTKEQSND